MPDRYLRDLTEHDADPVDADGFVTDVAAQPKESAARRMPGGRLRTWVQGLIDAAVPAWARAPQPPAGQAGEAGNFERTIFHVSADRPAAPTTPSTVPAGTDPAIPAGWTDGSEWAGAGGPGDTPIYASIQRVARAATAVTYTPPVRWDGPDGMDASTDADFVADIRRRLDRQEHLTSEIGESVRTDWVQAPNPSVAGIYLVPRATEVTLSAITRYAYAVIQSPTSSTDWQVVLRLPVGRHPSDVEVTRRASDGGVRPTLAGHWGYQLTQDGFTYWTWHEPEGDTPTGWHGWLDLDIGDVLTARITNTVEGTSWLGDVRDLDFHEGKPYAHHDSPTRVSDLGIGAPIGREVYLTREIRHPAAEQMHDVPQRFLTDIEGSFACHALGTGEAGFNLLADRLLPDQSPAAQRLAVVASGNGILATTRIAAIYQVAGNGAAYLYLPYPLDPDDPTARLPWKLHLKLGDGAWTEYSLHQPHTAQPTELTIGGVRYHGWQTGNFGYVGQPSDPGAGAFETLAGSVNSLMHIRLEYNAEPGHAARRFLTRDGVEAGTYGASAVDLTSVGGPRRATDTSGYPDVMAANRLAAIWQEEGQGTIRLAVLASIGTPTRLHVSGLPDAAHEHTWALADDGERTVGGNTYRFVYATGAVVPAELQTMAFAGSSLRLSLGYGDPNLLSYLAADGTLVNGSLQPEGYYQSLGDGTWESREDAIADDLGIADVTGMPTLVTTVAGAGAGGGLRVGSNLPVTEGFIAHALSAESTDGAATYLRIKADNERMLEVLRDGTLMIEGVINASLLVQTTGYRGWLTAYVSITRGGATTKRLIDTKYMRGNAGRGAADPDSRTTASVSTVIPGLEAGDILTISLTNKSDNAIPITDGRFAWVWLGAVRGEPGSDGQNVRVLREVSATDLPRITMTPGSVTSVIRVILTYRERHQTVRAAAAQNINLYRGGALLKQRLATLTPEWAEALPLMAVDVPASEGQPVTYGVSTQHTQSTPGDIRNYSDFELVVLDYGAAPSAPVQSASAPVPYSRQRTFFRWQQDSIATAPDFSGATWAGGNFYGIPAGWMEVAPNVAPAGHSLWVAVATADQNGSVSAVVTRVVDGYNVRWYVGDNVGTASSAVYVEGTHHYYRLKQANDQWGPVMPIDPTGENPLGWARLYEHTGVWHTLLHANPLAPTIDLAQWTEIAAEVLAHGFGDVTTQGYHWRGMTVPLPTAGIGPLAAHDDHTGGRRNTLFISFGGSGRASHLGLGGPVVNASFPRYDGIELKCVMQRAESADADTRIVRALAFGARGGGYSGGGDRVTIRIVGR